MILLTLLALLLMGLLAVGGATMPERLPVTPTTPLSLPTPTMAPTPGWWAHVKEATPVLLPLPTLPAPGLAGAASTGEPVSFRVLSCPTAGVQITDFRTASGPWWHIFGVADIPNLWYWKAEVSADGAHWALLYRGEAPVRDGLLVRLNLTTVLAGPLQLRLMAVDATGNYPPACVVGVR